MSKPLSKSRPGGGQPQSNQRQSDYSRQDRSNFQIRQGNTQGVHPAASNSLPQVNMHPQHPQVQAQQPLPAPQVQINQSQIIRQHQNYAGSHQQQPNQQPLVPQQTISVGHVNPTAPQPAVLQQHVIRNNQPFQPFIQNRMPTMPNQRPAHFNHHARPSNPVASHQMQNMSAQGQAVFYYPYANPYLPHHQFMPVNTVNYAVNPPTMLLSDPYQMRPYQTTQSQINMQNNIQQTEMINQTSNLYSQQQQQQQQQQQAQQPQQQQTKTENKKREKKMLKIYNDDGTEFNLTDAVNDEKKSNVPIDSSNNEKTSLVETKNSAQEEQQANLTVNGVEKDFESLNDEKVNDIPNSELIVNSEEVSEHPEEIQSNDSIQAATLVDEAANIQCDNETIEETQESIVDIVDKNQETDVNEVIQKLEDITLENKTESTDLGEIITNEDSAPLHDNSQIVSANTISGDMEVDTVKSVDDSIIDDSVKTDENLPSSPKEKDNNEDEDEKDDNELDNAPKLSRNSSQNGPRVYEKEFLLSLRDNATDDAISMSNQDNIKDIVKKNNNNKAPSHDMFLPNFANQGRQSQNESYRNKSQAQAVRRPSQPSKNYQDSKSRKIASTSLQHDMMYTPNENAWRPGKNTTDDPTEAETENLLKGVRAILNKLTPQNYQTLLEQFKLLKIDTKNRLTRVIDLIFDKAVKEPAFVVQYAGFCSELIQIKVTETNAKGENVEVKFKNLLIKKCEETFFREMYSDIENYNDRVKIIDECTDEKRKKDLEAIIDDDKRLSRRRSIGNIKLIAELYKLNMLNAKIMFSCFHNLLKHQHEEYIECLCALITNIGLNLTNAIKSKSGEQMDSFESIFTQLKAIYDEKSALKVSSRIRFMILDLLDLRKNNWVPRRKAEGPKTIAQVHEDMEKEARLKSLELSEYKRRKPMGPRDREPDEWQQVKPRKGSNIGQAPKIVNLNVLKESLMVSKPSLGASTFGMFAHGSHGGTNSNSQSRSSSSNFENKYQLLSSHDRNPKSNSTFHDSLHAKDQLRRDERKTSDVTNYYQSNRDGSLPNSRNSSTRSVINEAKSDIEIDKQSFMSRTSELCNNYLKSLNFNLAVSDLLTFCSKSRFNNFISDSVSLALEKTVTHRQNWGKFLGELFVNAIYDVSEIFEGFKALFASAEDLLVDLPKFWEFVAEIIANALSKAHETGQDNIKKEVYKAMSRAFGEVTGHDLTILKNSISDTLKDVTSQTNDATDIMSNLQFNSQTNAKNVIQDPESKQAEVNALAEKLFQQYMNSNSEITSLEEEIGVDLSEHKKFISALFYKVVSKFVADKILEDNSDSPTKNKLVNIIRHYTKHFKDAEVELLFTSSDLFRSLNNPPNLLSELFTLFHNEKLATGESFSQFQKSRRTPAVSLAAVERTIKNFS